MANAENESLYLMRVLNLPLNEKSERYVPGVEDIQIIMQWFCEPEKHTAEILQLYEVLLMIEKEQKDTLDSWSSNFPSVAAD